MTLVLSLCQLGQPCLPGVHSLSALPWLHWLPWLPWLPSMPRLPRWGFGHRAPARSDEEAKNAFVAPSDGESLQGADAASIYEA